MDDFDERKLVRKVEKAREGNNLEAFVKSCRKLASFYENQGRYHEALVIFHDELAACEREGDLLGIANANRMIGEMHNMLGQYEESLTFSNVYLEYAKQVKNKVEEQRAMATLGRTYFCWASDMKRTDPKFETTVKDSRKAYIRSLYICENELKDINMKEKLEMKGRLLYNLGLVSELQEDFETSHNHFSKAVQIYKAENLFEDLCKAYDTQGSVFLKQGDIGSALSSFDKALDAAKHSSISTEQTVISLLHKAEAYFQMSNYIGAKNVLKKAYKIKSPNTADNMTVENRLKKAVKLCMLEDKLKTMPAEDFLAHKDVYENLGDLCCAVKNYKHGIESYLRMLDCAERAGQSGNSLLPCYESLSQTYRDDKQYAKALAFHRKELEVYGSDLVGAARTHVSMGEVMELLGEPYGELADTYHKAAGLAREGGDPELQVAALQHLATVQGQAGKAALAGETERDIAALKNNHCLDSESEGSEESEDVDDVNLDDVLSVSESEEFDRPRPRPVRTAFKVKRNEKGETQLHLAAIKGDVKRARRLIEQGHPLKAQDSIGWTPLHEACNHGHAELVALLLESGADVNDPGGRGCKGVTPLHDAAACGHEHVIEALLQRGASTSALNDSGETPLDCFRDWRRRVTLNKDEELIFKNICDRLKPTLNRAAFRKVSTDTEDAPLISEEPDKTNRSVAKNVNLRRQIDACHKSKWRDASPETPDTSTQDSQLGDMGKSAQDEYKSAMEALRKRTKYQTSRVATEKNDSALVNEGDYVEDWLEDDLAIFQQPQKKRKTALDLIEHSSTKNKSKPAEPVEESSGDGLGGEEIEEMLEPQEPAAVPSQRRKQKRQLTLLKTGFQRASSAERSEATPAPEQNIPPAAPANPIRKVRVRVEGQILLIPLPSDAEALDIGWLVGEAAKRYYQLEGVEPLLRLQTKDGAILSDRDPLSLIYDEELEAAVKEWKTTSLTERYREACGQRQESCDLHVLAALDMCRATQCLDLEYLALTPAQLRPVFSALRFQHRLKSLNLSGNVLGDEGLDMLAKWLRKSLVQEINLSCNNISNVGAKSFVDGLSGEAQRAIQHLDLSFNPLGAACVSSLASLTSLCPGLENLKLQHCN